MDKHKAADYRAMAERVLAEATKLNGDAKATMLEIASRYEWMADWVERQERTAKAG
jgi:hypothetical protein